MPHIDKVGLVVIEDRRLLCARSRGKSLFYIPGGKREAEETDDETLIREIGEELAVGLIPETICFIRSFIAQADEKADGMAVSLRCYSADYTGIPKPAAEIEEIAWLGFEDIHRCSRAAAMVMQDAHTRGLI